MVDFPGLLWSVEEEVTLKKTSPRIIEILETKERYRKKLKLQHELKNISKPSLLKSFLSWITSPTWPRSFFINERGLFCKTFVHDILDDDNELAVKILIICDRNEEEMDDNMITEVFSLLNDVQYDKLKHWCSLHGAICMQIMK
jgi:hypothetical protein